MFVELADIRVEKGDAPFRPVLELLDGRGVGVADPEPAPEPAGVFPVRRGEFRRVFRGLTVDEKIAPEPRALRRAAAFLEGSRHLCEFPGSDRSFLETAARVRQVRIGDPEG